MIGMRRWDCNMIHLNVKGLSAAKRTTISTMAHKYEADVILLQETHVDKNELCRLSICGYDLITYHLHNKHGRAAYIKTDRDASASRLESTEFFDTFEAFGYRFCNVYKSPNAQWR